MKIAFAIGVNDVGGAEYVSYQHVLMAKRSGMEVIVLSGTGGMFADMIRSAGIKIEIVGMKPDLQVVRELLSGCDVVFNCNFFGIVPVLAALKPDLGFRYLTIIHSDISWVYDQCEKFDSITDGYYAIHQKIVDSFVAKGVMDEWKFTVIPNCVDVDLIEKNKFGRSMARTALGYSDNDFVIGMITRVCPDKNILDAVKILSKLPKGMNARLLIVGGAAESSANKNYLMRVHRAIRLQATIKRPVRVEITGNLPTEGVYRVMRAFDLGLNCSPSEGLPIALLEMMSAEIPCVMPSIGDIPDVLTGRGVVVPLKQRTEISDIVREPCYTTEEIDLFVRAIIDLYGRPAYLKAMGSAAAKYVREFRSLQFQEKQFLNFINVGKKTVKGIENADGMTANVENKTAVQSDVQSEEINSKTLQLPIVSVLMPIRDGNPLWVEKAIESIGLQDYTGKIQLVVINHDCRLSLTEAIARIVAKEPRLDIVTIQITDLQMEFSEILDHGVESCDGSIIVRMDCDDIARPNLVSKLVEYLDANKDVDVCGVQLQFFGAKSMLTNHPALITRELAYKMPGTWFINHPGVAIRKSAFMQVYGYGKTKTGYAEDYRLWCKILKAGMKIANLPEVLIDYRCYQKDWRNADGYAEFIQREKAGLKED